MHLLPMHYLDASYIDQLPSNTSTAPSPTNMSKRVATLSMKNRSWLTTTTAPGKYSRARSMICVLWLRTSPMPTAVVVFDSRRPVRNQGILNEVRR